MRKKGRSGSISWVTTSSLWTPKRAGRIERRIREGRQEDDDDNDEKNEALH